MSLTPVTSAKTSPYGSAIKRSLLTPCRRVGLSRKKKTPNSISQLLTPVLEVSKSNTSSLSLDISPLRTKSAREQQKISSDGTLKNEIGVSNSGTPTLSLDITPVNTKTYSKRKGRGSLIHPEYGTDALNSQNTAKKSLTDCFKNEPIDKSKNQISIIKSEQPGNKLHCHETVVKVQIHAPPRSRLTDTVNVNKSVNTEKDNDRVINSLSSTETKHSFNDINNQSVVENVDHLTYRTDKENKKYIDYKKSTDSDEDCIKSLDKPQLKISKRSCDINNLKYSLNKENVNSPNDSPIVKKKKTKILVDSDDECIDSFKDLHVESSQNEIDNKKKSPMTDIKDCTVQLLKLNQRSSTDSCSMYDNVKRRRKDFFYGENDEDNDCFSPKLSLKKAKSDSNVNSLVKKSSKISVTVQQSDKQSKNDKIKNVSASNTKFANIDLLVDEDDAFTSTPESDKHEKADLIEKIKNLESKIGKKKLKIDNLQRACIYKSKHDINDLKDLTEKWKQGCITGLNELLTKLQTHGPIDMATLLRNLHITGDMESKLFKNA